MICICSLSLYESSSCRSESHTFISFTWWGMLPGLMNFLYREMKANSLLCRRLSSFPCDQVRVIPPEVFSHCAANWLKDKESLLFQSGENMELEHLLGLVLVSKIIVRPRASSWGSCFHIRDSNNSEVPVYFQTSSV